MSQWVSPSTWTVGGISPTIISTTTTNTANFAIRARFIVVIAGDHDSFLNYLSSHPRAVCREINNAWELNALELEDIEWVAKVGEYWRNPVWGSDRYIDFMDAALLAGRAWAEPWSLEYYKYANPEFLENQTKSIIDKLLDIEKRLSDDA